MNHFQQLLATGLIVDNFAGGGGASTGIELALGRPVDIAINHDPEAIAMHRANHPNTRHYCQDVWDVDPVEVCQGRPVALAWFSPDCKHFSKAKGGKPREAKIRDLAWVVHRWIEALKPTDQHPVVIMLENVEEFRTWGPLLDDGKPCPARKGETFADWVQQLRDFGYAVQWKELRACDYGAPTSRKRLFLIARRDGQPIVWPEPSHGPLLARPWRTAADIIDWSLPCPSIFERARPLKDATCRRIATGIMRYVINAQRPFIVPVTNTGWNPDRLIDIDKPLPTLTTSKGGEMALVSPFFARNAHSDQDASGKNRGRGWHSLEEQFPTVTASQDSALVMPIMAPHLSTMRNSAKPTTGADEPLHTIVANGANKFMVAAFMAQHNGCPRNQNIAGHPVDAPTSTITGRGAQQQLVMATLFDNPDMARRADQVNAFLIKYYSAAEHGQSLLLPLDTITSKPRFGLVTVAIDGTEYAISDIGMRMLSPRELYKAQGFPDQYRIDFEFNGKPLTKTAATRMCGNSVCPPLPHALVRANLPQLCPAERAAA